jgi:hypothetical protein
MPPIPQQGSRAGLITALVIFAILFVTSTIFAFIYSAKATRAELDFAAFTKEASGVYSRGQLNGPEFEALKAARGAEGSGTSNTTALIDVATGQTRQVAALLGAKDAPTAVAAGTRTLNAAKEKLKNSGVALGSDLVSAVDKLANAVVARDGQIAQLTADRDASVKQIEAAKAQQTELASAHEKAVAEVRATAEAANASLASYQGEKNQSVAAIEAEREAERTKAAAEREALNTQIVEKDGQIKQKDKEIAQLRQRLAGLRGDVNKAVLTQADGTIIRMPGNSIAYIDLGAGDQIAPGLTFEVYDKADGVPVPASNSTELPQGKASLEVLRVGGNSAECRITPGQQLVEGDLIANLVYDRNTKYTFYVWGNFDLDHNGVATANDQNVMKQLITQWGGKIGNEINVNTDFLVVGAEPVVPNFTEEEKQDPVNQKKLEDATAEADAYAKLLEKAGELNIPVLNQNRFLYYVGYYEQARR